MKDLKVDNEHFKFVQRVAWLTALLICMWSPRSWSQASQALSEHQEAYEERILQERLNGRYIPIDVEDALRILDEIAAGPAAQRALALDEETFVSKLFFGFGRWMTINWSFYDGSRLSHHLRTAGLSHPDDMTKAMMIWFHRHLQEKPLEKEKLIADLREAREKARNKAIQPSELQGRN
ncbi:MAG: hypothetical protein KTR24_08885 [Saprospiraceae bacterium]|nr:hypothetical protein [Saprospiraceae bacterium]